MSTSPSVDLRNRFGIRPSDADLWLGSAATSTWSSAWRRLLREPTAAAGAAIIVTLALLAVLGPIIDHRDAVAIDPLHTLQGPSAAYPFGTDNVGRDLLARVLAGARVSLSLAVLTGGAIVIVGVVIGAFAGYFGGWLDAIAMRIVDVLLAFPTLVLALAIAGALGSGYITLIVTLVITWWPSYARLVRGSVLAERHRDYVDAIGGLGARPARLIFRHILPNVLPPVIVLLSFDLGFIILAIAALGYLGVGISPPTPEWGTMVADGRQYIFSAPQMIIFPGLAIAFSVVGFNLLGEGSRNILDPRRGGGHGRRIKAIETPGQKRASAALAVQGPPPTGGLPHPPLLSITDLKTIVRGADAVVRAVDAVSFSIGPGETLGLVGESGCGKTMTALSILRLLPPGGEIVSGAIFLQGRDLTALSPDDMRAVRGAEIGMVFQDPMTSLNPTMTIGDHITEPLQAHLGLNKIAARERAAEALAMVGMPRPREHIGAYPHQLSGGMRQRVMIAMALACEPKLLIADEPTTSLDVTVQAQILELLGDLQSELRMGLLLITHDMGVIAGHTERVLVMYAGQIVESIRSRDLFTSASHRYTRALLESLPPLEGDRPEYLISIPGLPASVVAPPRGCRFHPRCGYAIERCVNEVPALAGTGHAFACFNPATANAPEAEPVLGPSVVRRERAIAPLGGRRAADTEDAVIVDNVWKEFPAEAPGLPRGSTVKAVSGVSFSLQAGLTLGLVGESGCGKTTLARLITALERPDSGRIRINGSEVNALRGAELRRRRRDFQLVFQNAYGALDPRMYVGSAVREPLLIQQMGDPEQRAATVRELLNEVGLEIRVGGHRPHELSGGQRQRVGFARALTLQPSLLVADEPVSALDVSIRSQLLNLMRALQTARDLTYVLISHDLSVIRFLADVVGVMYLGKLVEIGPTDDVYGHPLHPYTRALIDSIPKPAPERDTAHRRRGISGELPSAISPPSGCRFRTRCPRATELCAQREPELRGAGTHQAACHFPLEVLDGRLGGQELGAGTAS